MTTKKILVTGGAGFIGSHLVDRLVRGGHDVRILDNLDPQVHHRNKKPDYLNSKAKFIRGDVRNKSDLKKALSDIEIVFHEAASVGVGQSMYRIKEYVDINTHGTSKLLDYIVNVENDVEKIVVASSMSIYGEGAYECSGCGIVYPELRSNSQLRKHKWEMTCPECKHVVKPIPTSEDKPLHPTSIYAITKRDQEEMCLTIGRAYGIPTVALRYFNVYGPRQSLSNPYTGVAAIFSSRIKNNNPPIIFEDGLQSRDFISVKDIVEANMLAMEKNKADYEAFNVGTGKPITILEVAETLIRLYGKKGVVESKIVNKYRAGDIRHCYADASKIRRMLEFKPKVEFKEGMKELVAWGATQEAVDLMEKAAGELIERKLVEK